jgi:putative oxidoreductase
MGLASTYDSFAKSASKGQSVFLLLIRLYIGYQCMVSGYEHLSHFDNTVATFRDDFKVPMPRISAAISGATELGGGALLLVGLAARLVCVPLVINFIVALLAANLSDPTYRPLLLHFWDHPNVIINDTSFPFLMTSLIVLLFGPGIFSIDGMIRHFRRPRTAA